MMDQDIGGIEFEIIDDGSKDIIRGSYRIFLQNSNEVKLKIDDIKYKVLNISQSGIGFQVKNYDTFCCGDLINNLCLTIRDETFDSLKCRVMHVSVWEFSLYICGAAFAGLDYKFRKALYTYIDEKRAALLNTEFK